MTHKTIIRGPETMTDDQAVFASGAARHYRSEFAERKARPGMRGCVVYTSPAVPGSVCACYWTAGGAVVAVLS